MHSLIKFIFVLMQKQLRPILLFLVASIIATAQNPNPALIGYWQNWYSASAPYIQLNQVDSRYNIVDIAFAIPQAGTDYNMEFIPYQVSPAVLVSQIQTLQAQGKKVIISVGGATAPVSLDNITERDTFITSMNNIITSFGFDGIDIDLEGSSVSVSGGTISNPTDAKIINLIYAIKQLMADYYAANNKRLILTMAPETAFVQGGMSAYGGIWGAYLPVIHALRDSIEILNVQLYNSGSMYGIDGGIYTQGTADFIIAMTEAVIQGFNTGGGMFAGLSANKVAVGLPACPSAAGGGFTDTATVRAAMNYLLGSGPQPGTYTLVQAGGYSALRGMMTWSINWDAVSSCASVYEYAENFENIFGLTSVLTPNPFPKERGITIYPNPNRGIFNIYFANNTLTDQHFKYKLMDLSGRIIRHGNLPEQKIEIKSMADGMYQLQVFNKNNFFAEKIIIEK